MIYITGANGFIGKAINLWLSNRNYPVTLLQRNSFHKDLTVINEENILIHCAWEGVLGKERNDNLQFKNINLTNSVIDFIKKHNIKRLIAFGSQAEYGSPNKKIDEDFPLSPNTLYGETKIRVFNLFKERLSCENVEFIWLRLFDPYGPGDKDEWFIPYVIKSALLNQSPKLTFCKQTWDFIFIDDICSCIETIIRSKTKKSNIFNLSSNNPIILREVVEKIFKIISPDTAKPLFGEKPFRKDQVYFLHGCNRKLLDTYKWKPIINLAQGLKATIDHERKVLNNR